MGRSRVRRRHHPGLAERVELACLCGAARPGRLVDLARAVAEPRRPAAQAHRRPEDGRGPLSRHGRGRQTQGRYVDPSDRTTFRVYAEGWRAAQVHRPTTAAYVETMLRRHIYPVLGDRPTASIRRSHVRAWVKGLTAALAPSTVGTVHGVVAGIVKAAVRDRRIAGSPCEGTRLPRAARRQVDPLTTGQVSALLDAVPERYRALVMLAAGTGLRQGGVRRDAGSGELPPANPSRRPAAGARAGSTAVPGRPEDVRLGSHGPAARGGPRRPRPPRRAIPGRGPACPGRWPGWPAGGRPPGVHRRSGRTPLTVGVWD